MLVLIAVLVIIAVTSTYRLVQAVAPSNLLIAHMRRTSPSLRGAGGLAILALLLVAVAHLVALAIATGAPAWLNLVVLILAWDAIKFGVFALLTSVRRVFWGTCGLRADRPRLIHHEATGPGGSP